MLPRLSLSAAALCIVVCATALQAQSSSPLSARFALVDATVQGPMVQGTLRLTVANTADQNITAMKVRLVRPAAGMLGPDGIVDVGDVEMDATAVVSTTFRLEKAFLDSPDPLTVEATFRKGDGTESKAALTVTREAGGR